MNEYYPLSIVAFMLNTEGVLQLSEKNIIFVIKIINLKWRTQPLAKQLPELQKKHALKLIKKYKKEILQSWIDYFVLHKKIKAKRLSEKL